VNAIQCWALPDIPAVQPGDDIGEILCASVKKAGLTLKPDDILVVAQKIVSKAEGRMVSLSEVDPSKQAVEIAESTDRDPRLVEVILRESNEVVLASKTALVMEHRSGVVCANAGLDRSNIGEPVGGDDVVCLLPEDADVSARRLRDEIRERSGVEVAVIVSDTHGRAFRRGVAGVAIGAAGIEPLIDRRGVSDLFGRTLEITVVAQADEVAAAASLLMGQAGEGRPAVLIRGVEFTSSDVGARALFRPKQEDLFRGGGNR
jgi:coenzyme F420-0:L-glutamate ligase/coenzyme F420-1:gamma-L-glutamate ligase